jgi:hypothetical protein
MEAAVACRNGPLVQTRCFLVDSRSSRRETRGTPAYVAVGGVSAARGA